MCTLSAELPFNEGQMGKQKVIYKKKNLVLLHLEQSCSHVVCLCRLYPLDFGMLINHTDVDPERWTVEKVWYSGALYDSLDDLAEKYANDPNTHKTRVRFAMKAKTTQKLRGEPAPETPQRPPVQVSRTLGDLSLPPSLGNLSTYPLYLVLCKALGLRNKLSRTRGCTTVYRPVVRRSMA